jgi:hypothetical protein
MKRPPYGLLVGVAVSMGVVAFVASRVLGKPLHDPDGFLGPVWVRLPVMVLAAFLVDILPRSLWRARRRPAEWREQVRSLVHEHWTRDRIALVTIGLLSFYMTYVSYRNLKNFLPDIYHHTDDQALHRLDRWMLWGHEPAVLLHTVLGETVAAQVLAFVYLLYLPLAPVSLVVWIVWSRNTSFGYWYATANCLTWALGTISYYAVPSLGPAFYAPWLYRDLQGTGVTSLQDSLWNARQDVRFNPFSDSIQSVAGFASLHIALTLTIALVTHYTVRHLVVRWAAWVYFTLTTVSTLYCGWHYVADDIAGAVIAFAAVWLGAWATSNHVGRWGGPLGPPRAASPEGRATG